jgi:hypothetical protein
MDSNEDVFARLANGKAFRNIVPVALCIGGWRSGGRLDRANPVFFGRSITWPSESSLRRSLHPRRRQKVCGSGGNGDGIGLCWSD